jgi:hypothetical protein
MLITIMDCFYIGMIMIIFGCIFHLEISMTKLTAMMKEHTKFDQKMSQVGKSLKEIEKKL